MAAPMVEENVPHIQAKFFTKQPQFAVPDAPFSVPVNVGINELSNLICSLLQSSSQDVSRVSFDFLIGQEFLRSTLQSHVDEKGISTENVIDIEYVERHPAPEPEDSLMHDDWVAAIQAMHNHILTGCYDNAVRIWDTEGELIIIIPGHVAPVKCVAWIQNDEEVPVKKFVTGSHDQTALLWEWNQQKNSVDCVHSCRGHAGSVDCVTVNPSKTRFCSGSWDKMLKIWSTSAVIDESENSEDFGEKPQKRKKTDGNKVPSRVPQLTLSGHSEGVSASVWLSESEICTSSWDHSIRIWDVEQGVQKSCLAGAKVFFDVSYSVLNKLLIAASADRHIRLYDPRITDGAVVKSTFTSHTAWISSVHWSRTNEHQFISGSYDTLVKLWDIRSSKAPLYDMSGHEERVLAVDWSMPQYMLSGAADNCLKIFRCTNHDVQGMHGVQS